MTKNKKPEPKITRKNVPFHTKLKLFGRAAGRCEFSGCNKPIWRNELTLTEGNFGEVAHIIAASEDGPRGNEKSADLQIEFDNLMLVCQRCHKEIDTNSKGLSCRLVARVEMETRGQN